MGLTFFLNHHPPEYGGEGIDLLEHGCLQVDMFRYNSYMSEILPDANKAITREYILETITQLTERLTYPQEKDNPRHLAETLMFCSYLLKEDEFPVWVCYST